MTKEELRDLSLNTFGYSERMTQDILYAYDLGEQAEREACAKIADDHETWESNPSNNIAERIRMRSNAEIRGGEAVPLD